MGDRTAVLVIAGFGQWVDGEAKVSKIETHIQPIAYSADTVDFVCTGPKSGSTTGVSYKQIEASEWKLLTLLRQFLVALKLAMGNDYDLIVSYSLIPYGMFALTCGFFSRTSTHLGIIGGDLDVHAQAAYGPAIEWLFRRFDIITVAGEDFHERLLKCGVDEKRIYTVLHPVNSEYTKVSVSKPDYDILWLTRVSSVKDPHLFVETLVELKNRNVNISAALVGSGPLLDDVKDSIKRHDIEDFVEVPGWSESPSEYYRNSRLYVLTSKREMLPLSLIEAMLVGTTPIVPPIGGIPDIVDDGENGVIVRSRDAQSYADEIERLLSNEELRQELSSNAPKIESKITYEAVSETWREIFQFLDVGFS